MRSSLGLTPADSLLYSPISIITEGVTEVLGLPKLLIRLNEDGVEGFDDVNKLLPLTHFLDGKGASFEYWCRLAKSQGCMPIIFVDNDRQRQIKQQKVKEKHPEVPIIVLDAGLEFEDIIPQEVYFMSLQNSLEIKEITQASFKSWTDTAILPERMLFTKRVQRWLDEVYPDVIYDKAFVMRDAIENVDLNEINQASIKILVTEIRNLAKKL